jgi:hypothetical protein
MNKQMQEEGLIGPLTIVTGQPVHGRVEKLGNRLARALDALIRAVGVMVHKRDLLSRFVCDVEISLNILSEKIRRIRGNGVTHVIDDEI